MVFYNTNITLPIIFQPEPDIVGPTNQDAIVSVIFRLLTSASGRRSINEVTANGCHFCAEILKIVIL